MNVDRDIDRQTGGHVDRWTGRQVDRYTGRNGKVNEWKDGMGSSTSFMKL